MTTTGALSAANIICIFEEINSRGRGYEVTVVKGVFFFSFSVIIN